ncbi:MAG TPA: replicative DNA helicase [Polyangiaceae bacterium]|jgi:replicative DNA helicase|nr:replicative DNA helicase [Polyangiaceae bacterium]
MNGRQAHARSFEPPAPTPVAGRIPPHDLDAEAAVLAAILLERDALDKVLELLRAEHFYSEANRRIYEVAVELSSQGTPIDVVSVAGMLRDRERLAQVGGSAYLAQLVDAVPSVAHIETYARMVREKWRVRQLIATCQRVAAEGYGDVGEVQQFIDGAEQAVYEIARTPEASSVQRIEPIIRSVFEQITELARRGERITGVPTGFERLDGKTAGLHDGELTIVAARPGMGKTSFVLNVAVNVASPKTVSGGGGDGGSADAREEPGMGVVVFSLEMPREQLASRMVCSEGRVDVGKMRQGFLQDRDWNSLTQAASFLYRLPIWIDDTPSLGVLELRAKVRRLQAEYNRTAPEGGVGQRIGLVIVDYLQLMSGHQYTSSREQEISEISRGLKRLSKELRVPVIALSQLNRAVETRGSKDKRPQLSDLRESGAIEQDADNIIFIFRDDYYEAESEQRGIAELIIAKQRNGPTGKVKVRFEAAYTRFDNLAQEQNDGSDDDE